MLMQTRKGRSIELFHIVGIAFIGVGLTTLRYVTCSFIKTGGRMCLARSHSFCILFVFATIFNRISSRLDPKTPRYPVGTRQSGGRSEHHAYAVRQPAGRALLSRQPRSTAGQWSLHHGACRCVSKSEKRIQPWDASFPTLDMCIRTGRARSIAPRLPRAGDSVPNHTGRASLDYE